MSIVPDRSPLLSIEHLYTHTIQTEQVQLAFSNIFYTCVGKNNHSFITNIYCFSRFLQFFIFCITGRFIICIKNHGMAKKKFLNCLCIDKMISNIIVLTLFFFILKFLLLTTFFISCNFLTDSNI